MCAVMNAVWHAVWITVQNAVWLIVRNAGMCSQIGLVSSN